MNPKSHKHAHVVAFHNIYWYCYWYQVSLVQLWFRWVIYKIPRPHQNELFVFRKFSVFFSAEHTIWPLDLINVTNYHRNGTFTSKVHDIRSLLSLCEMCRTEPRVFTIVVLVSALQSTAAFFSPELTQKKKKKLSSAQSLHTLEFYLHFKWPLLIICSEPILLLQWWLQAIIDSKPLKWKAHTHYVGYSKNVHTRKKNNINCLSAEHIRFKLLVARVDKYWAIKQSRMSR